MADGADRLRIKYGLRNQPTSRQVRDWADLTRKYISQGVSQEGAGDAAARSLFIDYRTTVYASEADTIEMLLREAGK